MYHAVSCAEATPRPRLWSARTGKASARPVREHRTRAIGGAPREVHSRHIGNCLKADSSYGKGVADAVGIPLSEVPK